MAIKKRKTKKRTTKASSLITRNKFYNLKVGAKNIGVDDLHSKTKYIPNTKANRDKITALKGKPDYDGSNKRYIWI